MFRFLLHLPIIGLLTILTQLGGLAWLMALPFQRRLATFGLAYLGLSVTALWLAPHFGREPLPCFSKAGLRMQSPLYCVLNRQYVVPDLKEVLTGLAAGMTDAFPDTQTLVLDANFPFFAGFPLLPHLSHDDGRKVDLAFYYQNEEGYLPGVTRSPIGYFAFEPGPTSCPATRLTLRWDLDWLQPLWPAYRPEPLRMRAALRGLDRDPRVAKIFLEQHLARSLDVASPKIRFQGCRAARHDDHIHLQL